MIKIYELFDKYIPFKILNRNPGNSSFAAKKEVFEFISSKADVLTSIDFRQFRFALIPYLAGAPDWKDWALIQLTS